MAVRTAAAAAIDSTAATLKTQITTYLALQQAVAGDAPALLLWVWIVGQLRNLDPKLAQVIDTANKYDQHAWGKTLSQIDGFA